jgi:hypothetical protein
MAAQVVASRAVLSSTELVRVIPVTGRGGLGGPTLSRQSTHTDGGEVVILMHRPLSTPQRHFLYSCVW